MQIGECYIGEDGLYYCRTCKKPKQTRVTFNGKTTICGCMCDCDKKLRDESLAYQKECRINRYRRETFSGTKHTTETFETDKEPDSQNSKIFRNYAKRFDPQKSKWLILYGDCGKGKSFYAAAICNAIIDREFTAKFTSVSAIIKELWNARDKLEYFERLDKYDLIVLDDFDAERSTEYANEIRYDVIEMRNNSCKPLIVTTNKTAQEMGKAQDIADKRIYSRLFEHGLFIAFEGKDKRKENLRLTMQAELDKLLNDD